MFKKRKTLVQETTETLAGFRDLEEFRKAAIAEATIVDAANKRITATALIYLGLGIYYGVVGHSFYKEWKEQKELEEKFNKTEDFDNED